MRKCWPEGIEMLTGHLRYLHWLSLQHILPVLALRSLPRIFAWHIKIVNISFRNKQMNECFSYRDWEFINTLLNGWHLNSRLIFWKEEWILRGHDFVKSHRKGKWIPCLPATCSGQKACLLSGILSDTKKCIISTCFLNLKIILGQNMSMHI